MAVRRGVGRVGGDAVTAGVTGGVDKPQERNEELIAVARLNDGEGTWDGEPIQFALADALVAAEARAAEHESAAIEFCAAADAAEARADEAEKSLALAERRRVEVGLRAMQIEAREKQLREALTDLLAYTASVEQHLAPWIASRPGIASFPDGGKDIGDRVRAALAAGGENPADSKERT